jgi:hypothetical protein
LNVGVEVSIVVYTVTQTNTTVSLITGCMVRRRSGKTILSSLEKKYRNCNLGRDLYIIDDTIYPFHYGLMEHFID